MAGAAASAWANPKGLNVGHGRATTTAAGSQLNVHVSNGAVLNWSSFNIAHGETTTFVQPNAHSVVWNNIHDGNPSQILGSLNANGYVVLMNPNGIYIGDHAYITAAGFIATAAPLVRTGGQAGAFWQFDGAPPSASVINYGQINVASGGSVYLVAPAVENHGTITAPDGKIGLYAGKELLLSERPDGRGLSAKVRLPKGSVDNTGKLIADAGSISIQADVVNQNGLIQANSVRRRNGVIELVANDSAELGSSSVLSAAGDAGVSAGGKISVKGGKEFTDAAGSRLNVSGGAAGGNGGVVELCADEIASIQSDLVALAHPGWRGGYLTIDPLNITIGTTGTGKLGTGGTVLSGSAPATGTLTLNVNSSFTGFSKIDLQATQDITVGTSWDLAKSTGLSTGGTLTLEAGRNIIFTSSANLKGTTGWSVQMAAGRNFNTALSALPSDSHTAPDLTGINSGKGGIYFNGGPANATTGNYPSGNGWLDMASGNIDLRAGFEVILGGGYVRTESGNLSIVTGTGDVATKVFSGAQQNGYDDTISGSVPHLVGAGGVSGFAVQGNGNIAIAAGNNIDCSEKNIEAFGVGVWGAGDMTLTAGNAVFGQYLVHNGNGTINAHQIGASSSGISLALATGHWNLNAKYGAGGKSGDIYLNEIFNPQGTFNTVYKVNGLAHVYDYANDASLKLTAGHGITLTGDALAGGTSAHPIYPPILGLSAGAGGITLGNDVVLYPAKDAALNVTTSDGGGFQSAPGKDFSLVMSDSDSADYNTFFSGHSKDPLQQDFASVPITLDISGDMTDINTVFPKRSIIKVGGDLVNCFLTGQNLLSGDVSEVRVTGDIRYPTTTTADAPLPAGSKAPDLSIFQSGILASQDNDVIGLGGELKYDPKTKKILYTGLPMTQAQYDFLLNPLVYVFDSFGNPVYVNGVQQTKSVTFEPKSVIDALYTASLQLAPFPVSGRAAMNCGGPGKFLITADNMQLGISDGIRSVTAALNPALGKVFSRGANLEIDLAGDLKLVSSTIGSFNGGSILINSGGSVDVGSQVQLTSADTPKGIYTGHGGSVTVLAQGDVNVNGSRIAAYDGGNVTVTSVAGSVQAGNGGLGEFTINTPQLLPDGTFDPKFSDTFFGSGILALTGKRGNAVVGDITITAGVDISSGSGGIFQDAFNNSKGSHHAKVTLNAGHDIISTAAGVLAENFSAKAGHEIKGLFVSQGNFDLSAIGRVNVTAVAVNNISIASQSTVTGDIFWRPKRGRQRQRDQRLHRQQRRRHEHLG